MQLLPVLILLELPHHIPKGMFQILRACSLELIAIHTYTSWRLNLNNITYNSGTHNLAMSKDSGGSIKNRPTYTFKSNPELIAELIKSLARSIKEGSSKMTRTVQILHKSGAIGDLSLAVREASFAARDTAREIRDTARDLKEGSVVGDTARAIQETTAAATITVDTVMSIASETFRPYPKVIMTRLPEWTAS